LLSRRNAGERVELNDMFREIEEISEHYRQLSGGAFDVAAGPLFDVWGFGFTADSLPSEETISAAMERCRKREVLNFNAIAQGYSCDKVAAYLHSIGVKDMLVDIGEIYCEGLNPKGQGWTIAIDTPSDGNNTPGASISGLWHSDGGAYGVVTSGNYRKFYIKDGKKYAHTIDPRTGRPVDHNLLSATVIAPTATEADALATYFMVIGFEKARSWVEDHPGIEACLISSDLTWTSPGF
ncbi:MAG: FAD:protein FMN transferase, partial [Bacteroidales bacterium]|nr:FAD:protein FMN transferase [Bacteroidales bacterium]